MMTLKLSQDKTNGRNGTRAQQLERASHVPLYAQLKQVLLEKIDGGEWKPGALIPSEQEMQDAYGLSRITVRQALSELVVEGRLVRERGRGTFVAEPKFAHSPHEHLGLTESLLQQGKTPGWRVLDEEWVSAPKQVAQKLQAETGAKIFRIRRLRLANNTPIGYHVAYVPQMFAAQMNRDALREGESLRYLAHLPQMRNSRAERIIEAVSATDNDAKLLRLSKGAPILQIERMVIANDGAPIELLYARYRGDKFKYQITL